MEVPSLAGLNSWGVAAVNSMSCRSAGNCAAGGSYSDGFGHAHPFVASEVNGTWGPVLEVPGAAVLNTGGSARVGSVSCGSAGNCAAGGAYLDSSNHHQVFVASEVNGKWGTAIEVPGTAALNGRGHADVGSVSCGSAGNCAVAGSYVDSANHTQVFVASQVNGTWGTAVEVPGTAALNTGGHAGIGSVSCASAGNCSAGGFYEDSATNQQAFVASEVNGMWRTAVEVPGTAALNAGGDAQINSVSCKKGGNCSAGGGYADSAGHEQAFVVSEVKGRWGTAIEVPGTTALNTGGSAWVSSVSCAAAGSCSAGGYYRDSSAHLQVFVASEVSGRWGTAIEVPGTAALNASGVAWVNSVSCGSAGNCSVVGRYADGAGHQQVFVASEVNGTWGTAVEVPGAAALNAGGTADIFSVSCASAGNCSAGGFYTDSAAREQAFVASEVNGTWGAAVEVAGTAGLNTGSAQIISVSCATSGNCAAGGYYTDSLGHQQAFVMSEVNGTWGTAVEVPGTAGLNTGGRAGIGSVSCASAGNCSAGGNYADSLGHYQAFVVSEVNGTWGTAIEVPGTAALGRGGATIFSVSCATSANCTAGGNYDDSVGHRQVFVVSEVNGAWGTAIEVPGTAALNTGGTADISSVSCASAGNCAAGGDYMDSLGLRQAFVVDEVNGTWGNAIEVPGTAALNAGSYASISSVSCAVAGACGAAGFYENSAGTSQAMVVDEVNGTWGTAIEVPGTAHASASSVSCASAGNCAAGGYYADNSGYQAFVVDEVNGTWGTAAEVPATAALNGGGSASTTSVSCASAGNCSAGGYYRDGSNHQQAFITDEVNGFWDTAIEVPGTAALNTDGTAWVSSVSCAPAGTCSAVGDYTAGYGLTQAFVAGQS
jgi:hypothetical protein